MSTAERRTGTGRAILTGVMLLFGMTLLGGCAGWRPVREQAPPASPDSFLMADSTGGWTDAVWWPAFGDTTLNRLMEEGFAENLTISQTAQRLVQFEAALKASRASWFPGVNASGSYTESDYLEDEETPSTLPGGMSSGSVSSGSFTQSRLSGAVSATYELDLWGKLHASRGAARADYLATREDLRSLLLTMSANIARSYYVIVELKQHKELLETTVEAYRANLELIEDRYRRGVVRSQDVYQARTTLAGTQAQLSQTEAGLAVAEHGLAVLLGRYPKTGIVPNEIALPVEVEAPPPGIPSELLKRRPDVRAAFQRMVAADRRAAEAVASLFPSVSLTGSLTGNGDALDEVTDPTNILWRAVGSVSAPLFQGGRLRANKQRAQAAWKAAVDAYKLAALNAFKDVEDALVRGRKQVEYVEYLQQQVEAADASLRLAEDQYLQGVTSYLPVVVAQSTAFNARRSLISGRRALVEARISLVTAMGGGWTDDVIKNHLSME